MWMYLAHLKVDSKKIQKSVFRNFRPIHRPEPVESLPVSHRLKLEFRHSERSAKKSENPISTWKKL